MNTLKLLLPIIAAVLIIGCAPTKNVVQSTAQEENAFDTDLKIGLIINGKAYAFVNNGEDWTGYTYVMNEDGAMQEIGLLPNEGWEEFDFMIEYWEILTLPDQSEIPAYKLSDESFISRNYKVVIQSNSELYTYEYNNPEGNLQDSWEAQNIVSFGTYVENEFTEI